jgi:5'-3' exonuclease
MAYRQPLKNVMMGIPRAKMGAQRCARKKSASNAKMAILPRQVNAKRFVEMG